MCSGGGCRAASQDKRSSSRHTAHTHTVQSAESVCEFKMHFISHVPVAPAVRCGPVLPVVFVFQDCMYEQQSKQRVQDNGQNFYRDNRRIRNQPATIGCSIFLPYRQVTGGQTGQKYMCLFPDKMLLSDCEKLNSQSSASGPSDVSTVPTRDM